MLVFLELTWHCSYRHDLWYDNIGRSVLWFDNGTARAGTALLVQPACILLVTNGSNWAVLMLQVRLDCLL